MLNFTQDPIFIKASSGRADPRPVWLIGAVLPAPPSGGLTDNYEQIALWKGEKKPQ